MQLRWLVIVMFGMILCLQGCETAKGAKDGFEKDWAEWQKFDDKLQEKLW